MTEVRIVQSTPEMMTAVAVAVETRKLASFRTVDAIEPIEGADAIELAVVGGWKVVTKKGEFKAGDPCVYFEIDSFLPDGVPAFQFLVDKSSRVFNGVKGHKLRTIKLRGQISQGLILPLTAFPILGLVLREELEPGDLTDVEQMMGPELLAEFKNLRFGLHELEAALSPEDLNLNKLLGIVKWDPPLNAQLAGMAEGLFPSFIRKTDQERCQNLKAEIFQFEAALVPFDDSALTDEARQTMIEKGLLVYENGPIGEELFKVLRGKADRDAQYEVTMKLDGSSMTAFARNVDGVTETGVCSRNLQLKVNEANAENSFVKMAVGSHLLAALHVLAEEHDIQIAVQGELMGPGIQENREQLSDFKFFVFDIFDIKTGTYLAPEERRAMVLRLQAFGAKIDHVPIIAHSANMLDTLGIENMDQLLKFAEGPSIKHPIREGVVFKRLDGQFSFKAISNKYLEKEKN